MEASISSGQLLHFSSTPECLIHSTCVDLLSCDLLCRQGPNEALNSTTFHPSLQQSTFVALAFNKQVTQPLHKHSGVGRQGRYVSFFNMCKQWHQKCWQRNVESFREISASSIIFEKEKDMHQVSRIVLSCLRQEVLESGACQGVSRILGATLPGKDDWLEYHWLQALFGLLSSRGVQLFAFRAWSRHAVALATSITSGTKPGLVEVLPNLLVNTEMLKFKSRELCEFIAELDRKRYYEEYLEDIKAHLEKHELVYWKQLNVKITIEVTKGLAHFNDVPYRIRDFYITKPSVHRCVCEVVEEGSNCRAWVVRCGNSIGAYRTKKAARMMAIIKEHNDPSFDLEGDSPPPSPYLSDQNRKRMRTVEMAVSSEDSEAVAHEKHRKKRNTEYRR